MGCIQPFYLLTIIHQGKKSPPPNIETVFDMWMNIVTWSIELFWMTYVRILCVQIIFLPYEMLDEYLYKCVDKILCIYSINRIGGVMVSVYASSAVDRGFEPRSCQTKDYEIGICCFSSKHAA
jgi:hypothetical protein